MAPAIVHFLVGASILLVLAAPLARYADRVGRSGLWLVVAGGVWALIPDLHNVTPVYESALRSYHQSPWADLFALHYTLDRPLVRALSVESTAGSIVVFLLAVNVFALARRTDSSRFHEVPLAIPTIGLGSATLAAAAVFGGMLAVTGRLESAAALVGAEEVRAGLALVLAVSAAGSLAFAASITHLPGRYTQEPFTSSLLGFQLGVVAWMLGVAIAVPLWSRVVLEAPLPLPFLDWPSLAAITLAGALVGLCYASVHRLALPPRPDR